MNPQAVVDLGHGALQMILLLAAPMLGAGLLAGTIVSLFQAVTQIHEVTLTFIPKIVAVFVAMLIFLPWMITLTLNYTTTLFVDLVRYAH